MQLSIYRADRSDPVSLVGLSEPLTYGRLYAMRGMRGYGVMVRSDGKDAIKVDIFRTGIRRPARSERVELLSSVIGIKPDGSPQSLPCKIDLHPDRPIFPINDLARRLMREERIPREHITPLNRLPRAILVEPGHASPSIMLSDDIVSRRRLGDAGFALSGDGTWAILACGPRINRVYLTLNAADKTREIINAIALIRAGRAQPIYDGE